MLPLPPASTPWVMRKARSGAVPQNGFVPEWLAVPQSWQKSWAVPSRPRSPERLPVKTASASDP